MMPRGVSSARAANELPRLYGPGFFILAPTPSCAAQRVLPAENLAAPAVYQGGSLPAGESISGRIALLTGWSRLQPDATQAQTLGMAALVMSDWLPRFCIRSPCRSDQRLLGDDLEGRARGDRPGRAIQRRQTRTRDALPKQWACSLATRLPSRPHRLKRCCSVSTRFRPSCRIVRHVADCRYG
jgi:hypothetical protein